MIGAGIPGLLAALLAIEAGVPLPVPGDLLLSAVRSLVLLVVGGSIFVQVHLILGIVLGPAARHALAAGRTATVAVLVLLAVAGAAAWLLRRGRAAGTRAAIEASCPACFAAGMIADRVLPVPSAAPQG